MRIFTLLLLMMCNIAGAAEDTQALPIEWKPIVGFDYAGLKAFVDINDRERNQIDEDDYGQGSILIVLEEPGNVKVGQETVTAKSVMKYMVVDCSNGMTSWTLDLYFDVEMPTRHSKPLAGYKYNPSVKNVLHFRKTSFIYLTFCPSYI